MLLLILNSCRSPREDLHILKNRMPSDLFDQAEVFDTGALDTMPDTPRVIALLTSDREKDADLIRELLKEESITDMEVLSGELVVEPQMENSEITLDDASELYGCTASELITIDQNIDELAKKLQRIITTKSSGIPFPETLYKGEYEIAYKHICNLLPIVPMVDKGGVLYPSDIEKHRNDRPGNVSKEVWKEVLDHLALEVRYFRLEIDWFGDGGHMRNALRDKQFFDYNFVEFLNDTYLKIDKDTVVTVFMDVCMGTAIRIIGKTAGTTAGAVLSALWTISKASMPDPQGRINAAIKAVNNTILETFRKTINTLEDTDTKLSQDWGLLNEFGGLVYNGELVWPRDLKPIREASALSFQFQTLRSLLHLLNDVSPFDSFGVVQERKVSSQPRKRVWRSKGNYHLYTHSEKRSKCGVTRNYYYECYLGYMKNIRGTSQFIYQDAPIALQAKLFGNNIHSETDPQFKLAPGFLIYPNGKERNSWNLRQLCKVM